MNLQYIYSEQMLSWQSHISMKEAWPSVWNEAVVIPANWWNGIIIAVFCAWRFVSRLFFCYPVWQRLSAWTRNTLWSPRMWIASRAARGEERGAGTPRGVDRWRGGGYIRESERVWRGEQGAQLDLNRNLNYNDEWWLNKRRNLEKQKW